MSFHENYQRQDDSKKASEKSFGLVMACVFVILAIAKSNLIAAALAIVFLLLALFRPQSLRLLNHFWHLLGLALHHIVSPLILLLMFYGIFLPVGLLMRLFNQRPLAMGFNPNAKTYWKESTITFFKDQF